MQQVPRLSRRPSCRGRRAPRPAPRAFRGSLPSPPRMRRPSSHDGPLSPDESGVTARATPRARSGTPGVGRRSPPEGSPAPAARRTTGRRSSFETLSSRAMWSGSLKLRWWPNSMSRIGVCSTPSASRRRSHSTSSSRLPTANPTWSIPVFSSVNAHRRAPSCRTSASTNDVGRWTRIRAVAEVGESEQPEDVGVEALAAVEVGDRQAQVVDPGEVRHDAPDRGSGRRPGLPDLGRSRLPQAQQRWVVPAVDVRPSGMPQGSLERL